MSDKCETYAARHADTVNTGQDVRLYSDVIAIVNDPRVTLGIDHTRGGQS